MAILHEIKYPELPTPDARERMSSFTHAGRDARTSCLFAIVILAFIGVILYPVLSDATIPLWQRVALGVGGPVLGWLGALVGVVILFGGFGLLLHLRDSLDRRRAQRLEEILAGRSEARAGEVERLVARALARDGFSTPWGRLDDSEVVREAARRDGPHRRAALRLLLRHGRGAPEDSPVREIVAAGAPLLDPEELDEDDRHRLERWTRGDPRDLPGPETGG